MFFYLIFLAIFSPLFSGGLTQPSLYVIEASSYFFLFFAIIRSVSIKEKISVIKLPFIPLVLFILLIIFQLLPLPKNIVSIISPATYQIFQKFRVNPAEFNTLSIYPEATVYIFMQFLTYICVFFLSLMVFDSEKKITRFILVLASCGFIYSFYGFIKRFSNSDYLLSTFANHNHFAAYLEMVIPVSIALALVQKSNFAKSMLALAILAMTLALLFTLSRAGIISFVFSLIILLLVLMARRKGRGAVLVLVIVVAILVLLSAVGADVVVKRIQTLSDPNNAFFARSDVWKDSLQIVKDFPFFGTGLGTFGEIYQKYRTFKLTSWATWTLAHNEPLQLLVEIGILGLLLILIFFAALFWQVITFWIKRKDIKVVYLTAGCLAGLFSVSIHSFFDFIFHMPALSILYFILFALSYRIVYLKEGQEAKILPVTEIRNSLSLKITLVFLSLLCLFGLEFVAIERLRAENLFEEVKAKTKAIIGGEIDVFLGYKKSLKKLNLAIGLNPLDSRYQLKNGDLLLDLGTRADLKNEKYVLEEFQGEKNILSLSLKSYVEATDINPTNVDCHYKLGWLYGVLGENELMHKEFDKSLLLDPVNPRLKSAITKFKEGRK